MPADPARSFRILPALRRTAAERASGARAGLAAALTLEAERGALFLFVPVLLGLGAVLYFSAPFEPRWLVLLVACALSAALAAALQRRRVLFLAAAAALLCLCGATAAKLETLRFSTKMLGAEVTTRLSARVARVDRLEGKRLRLTLDVIATDRPKLRFAPERVRVTAAKLDGPVQAGMLVEGLVRLMPPSGPTMPGGYDFSFQGFFDGIGASGFFLGTPQLLPASDGGNVVGRWIENAREKIAARIRERIGGAEGEIAAALIVGVRGGVPAEVNEALRRTGLAHVLSISGLHMALVAGIAMSGARALLACFPGFASRRATKKIAAGTALLLVSGYLALSGADVAAVRSFLMLAIMLVAVLFDRAALSVRNLALAATVILLIWPHEILGPSFQMSFAATGALVASYAAWADWQAVKEGAGRGRGARTQPSPAGIALRRGFRVVLALAATSVVAGAATAMFGIYHFQRVSPLSLPANLVVMPIVSLVVMPAALGTMLAMPLGLDGPFLTLMGWGLRWMIGITQWFSDRSPLDAVGTIPLGAMLLAALALTVFTLATTRLRLAAMPLAALAIILTQSRSQPDLFLSEDGRLIGAVLPGARLAASAKGGGFTLDTWKHATAAESVTRPGKEASPAERTPNDAGIRFECHADRCSLHLAGDRTIVHANSAEAAKAACETATVLVIGKAGLSDPCAGRRRPALVLTRRILAWQGSATVRLGAESLGPSITFSVPQPLRPWHAHRRFSRAARELPEREPYRPGKQKQGHAEAETSAHRPARRSGAERAGPDRNASL